MKSLNKLFFALVAFSFIALYSCSDDDAQKVEPEIVNKYVTGKDLTTEYRIIHPTQNFEKDTFFALGYGYDITGKYAHPDGIRGQVIDAMKVKNSDEYWMDSPGVFHFGAGSVMSGEKDEIKENLIKAYLFADSTDMNANGKYKNAFNAIFNDSFEADNSFQDVKYYYNINSFNGKNRRCFISLYPDHPEGLSKYLSDAFLKDIDSLDPTFIIKKYGTHAMINITFGWREDYYYRSTSKENLLGRQLGAMEKVLGSSLGLGISTSSKEEAKEEKENLFVESVCGVLPNLRSNAWMFDVTNWSGNIHYKNIEQSFDPENLVLIDWGKNSLIPIYEFISDKTKREALKQAIDDYLSK